MIVTVADNQLPVRELIPPDIIDEVRRAIGAMSGIVEVAASCNLACDYCFAQRSVSGIMPLPVVERIIRQLLISNGREVETKFIWHGGEPLLAGIDFYRHVLRVQNEMRQDGYGSINAVQTNATLLDDEWTDFFIENRFGVGSSLDGLPELHDARRRTISGAPTYDLVTGNLARAKTRGLTPGVICVLDGATLPHVERIYRNLKALDLPFTLSPVTPTPGLTMSAQPLTPEQYSEALIRLFDVWFDDPAPTIPVNPPHSVLTGIMYGGLPLYCSADDSCLSKFISFLPDGTVYPCNRFAGESAFLLGNVMNTPLTELLAASPRSRLLERRLENLEPCATCDNSEMCRGGCAHHAHAFHGDYMKSDYYCQAFFTAFNYYKQRLERELRNAQPPQGGTPPWN